MVKKKKQRFDPKPSDLRKTIRLVSEKLEPEKLAEVWERSTKVAIRHYQKIDPCDPSTWEFYNGKNWLSYGIQEILNVVAGRPVGDYHPGPLNLTDLRDLANIFGIKISQSEKIGRFELWQRIVAWVKENEDSTINRLKKFWKWLEEIKKIDVTDLDYLTVHAPGYWEDRESHLDPDWRLRHLTTIFRISSRIQEVVDAKLKSKEIQPTTSGLSRLQLWVITHDIMNLDDVPNNAAKEVMWQAILEKIEADNKKIKA